MPLSALPHKGKAGENLANQTERRLIPLCLYESPVRVTMPRYRGTTRQRGWGAGAGAGRGTAGEQALGLEEVPAPLFGEVPRRRLRTAPAPPPRRPGLRSARVV